MNVYVTVTSLHWIHRHVVRQLLWLQKDNRYGLSFVFPAKKPYENALHHIVKDFLLGGYDFWLNIDSDNPPLNNPLDLVELNKDIIGLPTPVWHYDERTQKAGDSPMYWNAYDYIPAVDAYREHQPREGLQRVDAVGTGCVLFARRVFEHPRLQRGAFSRKLNMDGTVDKGNDISFCERARECGFEIYCHYGYPCDHYCEVSMNDAVKGFRNFYEP